MKENDRNAVLELIRCPVCFGVTDNCEPRECELQCVASCKQGAIKLGGKAEVDLEKCSSCSRCVQVCPENVIDKVKLIFNSETGKFGCPKCNGDYSLNGNIFYFYPRRFGNERFKRFYETFEERLDPWQENVARSIKVKNILNILPKNGKKIASLLDIGCAGGWIIDGLSNHFDFKYVTGLEISSSILEQLSGKMPYASFIAGDCEYLPLARHSYELALAVDVIEHIQDPEHFLREISRVSKNAVLKIPLENVFESFAWNIIKKIRDIMRKRTLRNEEFEQHINLFSKRSAAKLLKHSGLDIIVSCIPDNPWMREYTSFYFASPKKTMPYFRELSFAKRINIMLKYYLTLTFRRTVFIILRPFYHYLCYSSFYVYCNSKMENRK